MSLRKNENKAVERMLVRFERKAADEKGTFAGYGSIFGNVDQGADKVVSGCFGATLDEWKSRGELPAMFFGHQMYEGSIGDWLKMEEDSKGLPCEGKLWIDGQAVNKSVQAHRMITGTGPKGLSIGYITRKAERDERTGVRSLFEVDLLEVSIVNFPMNTQAAILRAKGLMFDFEGKLVDPRTVERALRDVLGLSASQAKAFMADGYSGLAEDRDDSSTGQLDESAVKELTVMLEEVVNKTSIKV